MDREGVRIAHVDEIAAEAEEPGDERRWKPVRATLGIDAFGANAFVADAGQLIVHEHHEVEADGPEAGHRELYVVLRGRAEFTLDGERVERAGRDAGVPRRPGHRPQRRRPRGRHGGAGGRRPRGAAVRRVRLGGRLGRLPRTYGVTTTFSASPLLMRGNASGVSSSDTTSVTTPRMLAVFCSSMSSACTWSR